MRQVSSNCHYLDLKDMPSRLLLVFVNGFARIPMNYVVETIVLPEAFRLFGVS